MTTEPIWTCPYCREQFAYGTKHTCGTATNNTGGATVNQDLYPANTYYEWPHWGWPYYIYYPINYSQPALNYPKCNKSSCLYHKTGTYGDNFGSCDCKSVYINEKGKCISFVKRAD